MLRGIRTASKGWIGRTIMGLVMGLLVISFAIWGIGDIFKGFGQSTVAKIGGSEITTEQFRQTYNTKLQEIGRQIGRPITPDQARALGFEQQIIGQLIAETALDVRARQLRLGLSDAEIAKSIAQDPAFRGPAGQFDRSVFDYRIRQAGYTEPRYVAERRRLSGRRQIVNAVSGGLATPKAALDAQNRYSNEERVIDYVILGAAQAGDIPPPSPEALAQYFEERKVLFRAPEYRKIVLLSLTPAEQAAWIQVSDEDAKRAYEERRARYSTPERRRVQQIVFTNADEARAASERIKAGTSFAALAAERGLKEQDVDLGKVTRSGMVDRAVADAAFSLQSDQVSDPVDGRFGTAIVTVSEIEPEHARSFEEVAPEIKREIAMERARAEINEQYKKIEDERAAGNGLTDVGQKTGLPVRTIEAADRSGRTPNGDPITGLPQGVDVLSSAFSTDMNVESDPLEVPGGGYVWYEVVGITPSRERDLEEVKERVESRWRDDHIAARLKAKADEMVEKVKAGTPLAQVATAENLTVESGIKFKRNKPPEGLTGKAGDAVFRTGKGGAGTAEGDRPSERVVFQVTDIIEPTLDANSPEAKTMEENLKNSLSQDILNQYIVQLQNDLGTTINQNALRQVAGGAN
jgi:peptidyl-prolyl cis-trans isomerase D